MADATSEARFAATMRNVAKYIYWILGIIIVGGASYFFYNVMGRPVTGILVFLGGVLALYFYYVKWLVVPERRPEWPPYKTPCPDYLTLMTPGSDTNSGIATPTDGTYKCMDFVGVSRNGTLKRADPRMISTQGNNNEYVFTVDPKEDRETLKQRVLAYGLTWTTLLGDD